MFRRTQNLSLASMFPSVLVYLFLLVRGLAAGAYSARHAEPSGAFVLVFYVGFLILTGYWFEMDSRKRGVNWVWDLGFLLYLTWPLAIPFYLFKTRGAKAFLILLSLIGTFLTGHFLGVRVFR